MRRSTQAKAFPTERGRLGVDALNLGNAHPDPFATSANAVPLDMLDSAYVPPAQPLTPRTFEVHYHLQVGNHPESLETLLSDERRFIAHDTSDSRAPLPDSLYYTPSLGLYVFS